MLGSQGMQLRWGVLSPLGSQGRKFCLERNQSCCSSRSHLQRSLWDLFAVGFRGMCWLGSAVGLWGCGAVGGAGVSPVLPHPCRAAASRHSSLAFPGGGGTCCPLTLSCLCRERGWTGTDPAALPGKGLGGQPLPTGHRAGEWLGTQGVTPGVTPGHVPQGWGAVREQSHLPWVQLQKSPELSRSCGMLVPLPASPCPLL